MLKDLFGKRATTRVDIVLAFGAAIMAAVKAVDVLNTYKTEQQEKNQ